MAQNAALLAHIEKLEEENVSLQAQEVQTSALVAFFISAP